MSKPAPSAQRELQALLDAIGKPGVEKPPQPAAKSEPFNRVSSVREEFDGPKSKPEVGESGCGVTHPPKGPSG